jgi:hypothetical protein
MTAEAGWMLDPDIVRVDRHVHVATDAIAGAFLVVLCVRETKVAACHLSGVPISRTPVAVRARIRIVRLLVALDAVGGRGKMKRSGFPCFFDSRVALEAVDSFHEVGAVLESMVGFVLLEAQHLGAGSRVSGDGDQCRSDKDPLHWFSRHEY